MTSTVDNIRVTFMSFSPDSVKHLLRTVPAEFICQLVDDINVDEVREELGLGPLTGGAVANVMKAAQLEGERILDDCEVGWPGRASTMSASTPGPSSAGWNPAAGSACGPWIPSGTWRSARELGIHEITTNMPAQGAGPAHAEQLAPDYRAAPAGLQCAGRFTAGVALWLSGCHAISLVRAGPPRPSPRQP